MRLFCLTLIATGVLAADNPDPKAFLRYRTASPAGYYIAVYPDPPLTAESGTLAVTVFAGTSKTIPARALRNSGEAMFTVEIDSGDQATLLASANELTLVIPNYPSVKGASSALIGVSLEVSASIDSNPFCKSGVMLTVGTSPKKPALANEYTRARSRALMDAFTGVTPRPVDVQKAGEDILLPAQISFGSESDNGTQLLRCVSFVSSLRPGDYRLKLTLAGQKPIEIDHPFTGEFAIQAAAAAPTTADTSDVGDRSLERNLDLGIQFTSAVADLGDPPVRQRTNQGTFDLRLAPLLNVLPNPSADDSLFLFFTPFFVDARVSTGHITEDNLSMNRINFGSDFEFRKYPVDAGSYPNYYRIIVGARNSSDRDFHQAEFKGVAEFAPVFGALNHPLAALKPKRAEWKIKLDDAEKDRNLIETHKFGWQVLPVLGTEFGRIYRNHFRAASVIIDENVRRFYFGGTISLDLTKYLTVSGEDRLYVRGETEDDRLHNYLKASLLFSLPAFTRFASHGLYLSFERGNQPPFATPDVNALKLGYRIQWDNWFDKWR